MRQSIFRLWMAGVLALSISCKPWELAGLPFPMPSAQQPGDSARNQDDFDSDDGDVTAGGGSGPKGINSVQPAGTSLPEFGVPVSVMVFSQSQNDAMVLVQYLVNSIEVHRSELYLAAGQSFTVAQDLATRVVVTGQRANGHPLPPADWLAGVDFNAGAIKHYIIADPAVPSVPEPAPDDACPDDPAKTTPGTCGCGVPDVDADANGIIDCLEDKTPPDADSDGIPDASDNCPLLANPGQEDCDGDGVGDACAIASCSPSNPACQDCNNNGIPDVCDLATGRSLDHDENGIPDECELSSPVRRYVDARVTGGDGRTWNTAYASPQQALAEAAENPEQLWEIWVAAGVYRPDLGSGNRSISFELAGDVLMYGGFAGSENDLTQRDLQKHKTILSGDLIGDDAGGLSLWDPYRQDNSYHVVRADMVTDLTLLDGFIVSGGNANGYTGDDQGGGILVTNSSLVMSNCTITGNSAFNGAGLHSTMYSILYATNCSFTDNRAEMRGGGIYFDSPMAYLRQCLLQTNQAAFGGGIHMQNGVLGIFGGRFLGNFAIDAYGYYYSGDGGACWNERAETVLVNCVFSGNVADRWGGAVYNSTDSVSDIINCTITANLAGYGLSSAIYNDEVGMAASNIFNSIIWNGTGNPISGPQSIYYSCVSEGTGPGVINSDPRFVRPPDLSSEDYGDLQLQAGSPAIDAGNNAYIAGLEMHDILENPRFLDDSATPDTGLGTPPIVDMGAYEADFKY